MAQIAHDPQLQNQIDQYLDYLARQWQAVPALAAEWREWDEHSRLVFALDWPIREDRLGQLEAWAEQRVLTASQHARYKRLLPVIKRHRVTLERLLATAGEPQPT